jgi:glycosyltransferase involved in cell wall biosynthesis
MRALRRIAIRTIDLERPITKMEDVAEFPRTRVFVSQGGELIGSVDIENAFAPVSATRLSDAIAAGLWYQIARRGAERKAGSQVKAALSADVGVSIVIPTCNRPDDLRRCLEAVDAQRGTRPIEVIVIDNRPGPGSATAAVVREFERVILLEEQKPGLSYARNAGFAAATGAIVVAIDDDVTVPVGWLERLVAPFARPEVMAVTGHVLPIELDTPSQCLFEEYGGLGKGFEAFECDGEWFRSRRVAVPTWLLGATANAAFRASIFAHPRIGMLDEALGAGMPTGCSEDTYLFYRILRAGGTIAYEPTAWVWHRHRRDLAALRRQIFAYSKGHIAYHLTTLFRDGDARALIRFFYSLPRTYLRRTWYHLRGYSDYPLSLIVLEIAGCLAGPWALWQARRRVRRFGPGARRPAVPGPVRETQISAAGMARPA